MFFSHAKVIGLIGEQGRPEPVGQKLPMRAAPTGTSAHVAAPSANHQPNHTDLTLTSLPTPTCTVLTPLVLSFLCWAIGRRAPCATTASAASSAAIRTAAARMSADQTHP